MKILGLVSGALIGSIFALVAYAVEPDEMLDDPALEERARVISQDLRCVVCQNETIDESNATLAQDMRRLVRQRILAGDSNEDVLAYMVDRYGDFVLLRPRVTAQTLLLWLGPFILLVFGVVNAARYIKRPKAIDTPGLSPEEMAEVDVLIQKTEGPDQQ
ncbi:MAG: cytochrome c-type biogenesis protein CcmH [Rhodospirillaceae bacterium]|nr:cytochrome c-type biogenesis protein CcmH [Rhodospirillaceae bacterium]